VEKYGPQIYLETFRSATLPATTVTWSGQVCYQNLGGDMPWQTASDM